MAHRAAHAALLSAGLLLGLLCTTPALHAAEGPASCPTLPVRIVHSNGPAVEYRGAYPGIADLCLVGPAGSQEYAYLGIWHANWPGAGEGYPALRDVINGPVGTRTSFITRSYPGLQWIDSFINQGEEVMVVDGRNYHTLKIAHERNGIEGNTYHSIITSWRDIATGVALKAVEQQISGESYGPNTTWTAIRVEKLQ